MDDYVSSEDEDYEPAGTSSSSPILTDDDSEDDDSDEDADGDGWDEEHDLDPDRADSRDGSDSEDDSEDDETTTTTTTTTTEQPPPSLRIPPCRSERWDARKPAATPCTTSHYKLPPESKLCSKPYPV